jgi:ubiquitin-conjugating enzyme E2 D/E
MSRSPTLKRLTKELLDIKTDIKKGILLNCSAEPINDDLFNWEGIIIGPTDSPYEGGIFKLNINFPINYPFQAPTINFKTKIYHPNVCPRGNICLDILKGEWSPALNITRVLLSISSLLTDPNANDPLSSGPAYTYKNDRELYDRTVREWVQMYAME